MSRYYYFADAFKICQGSIESILYFLMDNIFLYQLLERINNLLRAEQRLVGNEFGLQEVHLQVLLYLSKCNRYSNTPLGVTEYLSSTKGTVSQSIKVLEKNGYIVKQADDKDRRVVHLVLTEQGKKVLKQAIPPPLFLKAVEEITLRQAEDLEKLLTQVLTSLQQANQLRSFGVCQTCRFFTEEDKGFRCGLTKEPLSKEDSFLICREHE